MSDMASVRKRLLLFVVAPLDFFLSHRLPLAQEALNRGWKVVVVSDAPGSEVLQRAGIEYLSVPIDRGGTNLFTEWNTVRQLYAILRRLRPDIVHLVTIKPVVYGAILCRILGLNVVAAISGLGYVFISQRWTTRILRSMVLLICRFSLAGRRTRVIFQNREDLELFTSKAAIDSRKVALIRGSGINLIEFRRLPIPEGRVSVLFASRMLRDKGILDFVEACRLARAQGCPWRFVLAGSPDEGNPSSLSCRELQAFADSGIVEWLGHASDIRDVLAQTHIVCLPSYREGLPRILLEAAATARPLIATDVPGCREIVKPGVNGFLVPVRDPLGIVNAFSRFAERPKLISQMGDASRRIVEAEFGVERIVQETFELYDVLASVTQTGPTG
jgi:glycosyltransferase involved in cell wall biosynthesis